MSVKEPTIYPGVDAIRQIQQLMMLCALLPPDGKLRELLGTALSLHEEPVLARTTPQTDLHPFASREWLESIWAKSDLSPQEKELVDWQNDTDNMAAAMRELADAEKQLGVMLTATKLP